MKAMALVPEMGLKVWIGILRNNFLLADSQLMWLEFHEILLILQEFIGHKWAESLLHGGVNVVNDFFDKPVFI